MDVKDVNATLREKAIALGLCKGWQKQWAKDWSEDKMIAKYKEGIDFCLANGYPTNDFIKQNFTLDALRRGGLFIDDNRSFLNMWCSVIKGSSKCTARYDADNIGQVYVADTACLHIYAKGRSHVIVHVLDGASVLAEQQDNARLVVIRHSAKCAVVTKGDVAVKDEYDWLK